MSKEKILENLIKETAENLENANLEILRERTRGYSVEEQWAVASALKSEVMEMELAKRRVEKDQDILDMQKILNRKRSYYF